MSRWLLIGFLYLGTGFGSDLAATVLVEPFTEPANFLSMQDSDGENALLNSLWESIKHEDAIAIIDSRTTRSGRETEQPTADQSIAWAATQTDGPVEALAISQMPHVDEVVPLLVDFRNRAVTNVVTSMSNISPAFVGETPEPATGWPVLATVAILVVLRRGR